MVLGRHGIRSIPCFITIGMVILSIVLMPVPSTNAVVIVDDIMIGGTIAAWLGGLGVSLSGSLGTNDTTSSAFISGLKSISSSYDTFMGVADGFFWTNLQSLLSDVQMVSNTADELFIALPALAANGLIGFTNWLKTQFNIVSNMSSAITLYSSTGYFLADGSPIVIAPYGSSTNDTRSIATNFNRDVTYSLANGNYVNFIYNAQSGSLEWYTNNDIIFSFSGSYKADITVICFRINNTGNLTPIGYRSNGYATMSSTHAEDCFGTSTTSVLDGLGKDVLPDLDEIDTESDELAYVKIPDTVVDSLPQDYTDSDVYGGVIDDAIAGTITNVGTDSYAVSIQADAPLPAPEPEYNNVDLPFVGISLPTTYSLGLSGIWHYVREWLSSIASWFAWCRNVWSMLPSAMVVPIYASIVVVIVLGMYKRFFM